MKEKNLDKLIDVINTHIIKVITGGWRSGKSKLLDAFYDIIWIDDFGQNLISLTIQFHSLECNLNNIYISGWKDTISQNHIFCTKKWCRYLLY